IGYALLIMLVVILLYDQLLFRPLLAWSRKFMADEPADDDYTRPWFLIVVQRARFFDVVQIVGLAINRAIDGALRGISRALPASRPELRDSARFQRVFDLVLLAFAGAGIVWIVLFVRTSVALSEVGW